MNQYENRKLTLAYDNKELGEVFPVFVQRDSGRES